MSVFRASARTTSPDGREWEIYAYRLKRSPAGPRPRGIGRRLARAASAILRLVRSLGSRDWTIEAISWMPQKRAVRWTTTREFRGQVLAQVEGHLSRGDVPHHLTNAVYRGYV